MTIKTPMFVIRCVDSGLALGRTTLSGALIPVRDCFAYTWPTRAEAEAVARTFGRDDLQVQELKTPEVKR